MQLKNPAEARFFNCGDFFILIYGTTGVYVYSRVPAYIDTAIASASIATSIRLTIYASIAF